MQTQGRQESSKIDWKGLRELRKQERYYLASGTFTNYHKKVQGLINQGILVHAEPGTYVVVIDNRRLIPPNPPSRMPRDPNAKFLKREPRIREGIGIADPTVGRNPTQYGFQNKEDARDYATAFFGESGKEGNYTWRIRQVKGPD